MKLRSVLSFLGLFGMLGGLQAQNTSISPYSSYGAGTVLFDNSVEQAGMGGVSVLSTNPYYGNANFYNPAANRDLRFTTFEFVSNTDMSRFKDAHNSSTKSTTYISNISLAFPVGDKARAGFGFQPYTTVGYELSALGVSEGVEFEKQFYGEGGVNSLHFMGSYNINSEFSVGLRANYLFGDLSKKQIVSTQDLALSTDYSFNSKLNGVQFSLGGNYTKMLEDRKRLDIGLVYTLGSNINAKIENMTSTYSVVDLIPGNIDTVQYHSFRGDMKLPQKLSLGASYRKDLNWMIGAQIDWTDWSSFSFENSQNSDLESSIRISAGGFWLPNFNSYKSYFDRVTYRMGGFYETTPIKVNGNDISKYGLTIGAGFPIGKERDASMLNFAMEFGQMGTTKDNALKESFANFKIGFTINDIWFRKRVID